MSFRSVPPEGRPTIAKDPDASLRYGIDVSGLLQEGDAVSSAVVSWHSDDLTVGAVSVTGSVLLARVQGGTEGQLSSMTLRWTTTQGDTDERTLWFSVAQR